MKILGVNTSSDICSVCLLENTTLLKEINLNNGKTHSENLVPLLKELIDSCNISFKDIDLIAIDKGPGSFTGIRIGISTIKAIAEVHNIKIVGVTSLKSLAFNEVYKYDTTNSNIPQNYNYDLSSLKSNTVISLIDARNNQVYCGVFNKNFENMYFALDINETLDSIKNYVDANTTFVGNAAVLHKNLIQNYFGKIINFSETNEQSSISTALAGLEIFKLGNYDNADSILPFYLRKSQAERMKEINNNGNNNT